MTKTFWELKRVKKNEEYRWVQIKKESSELPKLWTDATGREFYAKETVHRYALIGHGSTPAYYLTALSHGKGEDSTETEEDIYRRMLLFGDTDPWTREVRGSGYINHEVHQISHWGDKVPEFTTSYMHRSDFVQQNDAAFKHAIARGATLVKDQVVAVHGMGDIFKIQTKDADYYAAFVICAPGLGAHRGLGDEFCPTKHQSVTGWENSKFNGLVYTLDEFMRTFDETESIRKAPTNRENPKKKLTIAVHGTNAGIDAVQRAWQHGHKVIWIMGNSEPAFLKGHRLPVEEELNNGTRDVIKDKVGRTAIFLKPTGDENVQDRRLEVYVGQDLRHTVDVYCISLGQDPFAEGCAGDILVTKSNLKVEDYEPIYDWNQHFGLPFQTVLGFQVKGTRAGIGLQIIGGAVESLAKALDKFKVQHNYEAQLGPLELEPTKESCARELEAWPSLKEKYKTAEKLFEDKKPRWERAKTQRASHLKLAEEYLGSVKIDDLLRHQVDPEAVPKNLEEMLSKFSYEEMNWFQKWQVATKDRPAASAVASVILPSQLGAVRAVVAALTNLIPDYITQSRDSNFNTDDRTMMAVHIALNFPWLSAEELEAEVSAKISLRRKAYTPLGFYDDDTRKLIYERWQKQNPKSL